MRTSEAPLILLVEDYADTIEIYTACLEFEGFRVIAATDADAAFEYIQSSPPDLILMDVGLPGMTGLEATQALKANDATRQIPVVIVTGHVLGDARVRAAACGADAFLTKPCLPDELIRTVREVLGRRTAPPPGERRSR